MPDLTRHQTLLESAYGEALECCAAGVERWVVVEAMAERGLTHEEIDQTIGEAYRDALKQGVEPEDMADDWSM
jgi:hypothetical protein